MRIAILHFKFNARLNYAENVYADTMHRLGHEVRVFTTRYGMKNLPEGKLELIDSTLPYPIIREKMSFGVSSTVIPISRLVIRSIKSFSPQIAIMLAPHHGPAYFWLKHLPANCLIVSGFSDLPWHSHTRWSWKYLKKPWIKTILKRSNLVLAMTDDTKEYFIDTFGNEICGDMLMPGLCYNQEHYETASIEPPCEARHVFDQCNQVISMITVTRSNKKIELLLKEINRFLESHERVGFVLAGCTDDEYGNYLRQLMQQMSSAARCVVLPLLGVEQSKALCEFSNCTIWPLVSVGIQQSMASGCPALVPRGMPTRHFLQEEINGIYYDSVEGGLEKALQQSVGKTWNKDEIKSSISAFSSDAVVSRVIALVLEKQS